MSLSSSTILAAVFDVLDTVSSPSANSNRKDAEDALSVLGYSRSEASAALKGIDVEKLELDDIIRLALKKLMK